MILDVTLVGDDVVVAADCQLGSTILRSKVILESFEPLEFVSVLSTIDLPSVDDVYGDDSHPVDGCGNHPGLRFVPTIAEACGDVCGIAFR